MNGGVRQWERVLKSARADAQAAVAANRYTREPPAQPTLYRLAEVRR